METENQVENKEEVVVEQENQSNEPQYTEIELKAMEMGWRPKEDFAGPEDDFIDAKEFVRRKPLFDKIEQMNRNQRQLQQTVSALKEHYTKVEQAAYDRAVRELKAKQVAAVKDGDLERYHEIQEEIENVREEQASKEVKIPDPVQEIPELVAWKAKNTWYQNDPGMTHFADEYGISLARQGVAPNDVLKAVEKKVRETFVHKFKNPNRERPGAVEGSSNVAKSKAKESYPLTSDERRIMNDLVKREVLTEEQYIRDLRKIKGE